MSIDLVALHSQHLDHHGPSRICAGPETCSAVGYLAIIEHLVGDRDEADNENARLLDGVAAATLECKELERERDTARGLAVSLENEVARLKAQRHIVAGHDGSLESCLYEICLHDLDVQPESWS